ncbi:MAG: shikimate dehydrogenase, partial [Synechococcus sp. SB0676_bin_10]|nr:shikimate dehydrogenase [Synechococcus sp. SB0676_bin_10]
MAGIKGSTKLLAVLGDPVGHSLSPVLQNAAIHKLKLDWCYLALPVSATALPVALEGLHALGAVGLNVTIPHKQAVMPLLRAVTPLAQRIGAVNTL